MEFRGNICLIDRFGGRVYLYTHKTGQDCFKVLQRALQRAPDRWCDEQYLARVIFCEMIKDSDINETAGFGITSFIAENDLPVFMVDVVNARIVMEDGRCLASCPCIGYAWTMEDFVNLKEDPRSEFLMMLTKGSK